MESLIEDYKLSACGRQPFVTFSFLLSFDLVLFCFVLFCFVLCFFRKHVCYSSLGELLSYVTPDLHRPFGIVFLATLETICHFSLGVG